MPKGHFVRTPEHRKHISESLKGKKGTRLGCKLSDETKRKIGFANSRKKHPEGSMNSNWKGDEIGIAGVHCWVKKIKGSASNYICEFCKKKMAKNWSNIDHEYKRVLEDYRALCISCHRKWDFQFNLPKNYTLQRRRIKNQQKTNLKNN